MSFARIRLFISVMLFFGWLAWLGVAVSQKGTVQIISSAQLTAATHVVVGTVTLDASGRADPKVQIREVLRSLDADKIQGVITIERVDKCVTPLPVNGSRDLAAGDYLFLLIKDGSTFRVAGLPRSPGVEASMPERPIAYPWTDDVKAQLRKWKLLP